MITDEILEHSQGILKVIEEPTNALYKAFNDGSTEIETSELLYAFVRRLKPEHILETGTYKGISSSYMASALKANKRGHLMTLEIDQFHIDTAKRLWEALSLTPFITSRRISSLEYKPDVLFDFMFLDSEPHLRFDEFVRFYSYLRDGGSAWIHDLPETLCQGNINQDHPEIKSWPFGDLPEEIKTWIKNDDIRLSHFPDARSLTMIYKVGKNDYK